MKLVDVIIATPSMLVPHNPADYPNVKAVAVAGEPCPKGKKGIDLDFDRLNDFHFPQPLPIPGRRMSSSIIVVDQLR